MSSHQCQVLLAVYDLSNGLARQLSQSFLGIRIDGIWHTGVVVFDKEYFFGGGIQCLPRGVFTTYNGLHPQEHINLGATTKTEGELLAYLSSIQHLYTQATYDLINHNCNNFSNAVVNFLLNKNIPSYILDLPRTVFNSPGGAMLRPMIENMQNGIRQQTSGAELNLSGYGSIPRNNPSVHITPPAVSAPNVGFPQKSAVAATAAAPQESVFEKGLEEVFAENPLISSDKDNTLLNQLAKKLTQFAADGQTVLNDIDKQVLFAAIDHLCAGSSQVNFQTAAFEVLLKIIGNYPTLEMSALFIARLIVLSPNQIPASVRPTVASILLRLRGGDKSFSSSSAIVMAICTVANLVSHRPGCFALFGATTPRDAISNDDLLNDSIDVACWGLTHSKVEIRQISGALAYNLALACTGWRAEPDPLTWHPISSIKIELNVSAASSNEELHPHMVQLLCATLEGIENDHDEISVRRRLLAAFRIVRSGKNAAIELMEALGFKDAVLNVSKRISTNKTESRQLCSRFSQYLN